MQVSRLSLQQFRTYDVLDIAIDTQGMRISGRNASGKTSFLEAIVMLSTTRSPRAGSDRDVIRWNSGVDLSVPPYSRIEASIQTRAGSSVVGLTLEQEQGVSGQARKQFLLDGGVARAQDVVGVLKCVLFTPEDVYLVSGPPAERRRQMDILISQIDRGYLSSLSRFGRILAQRNGLLRSFARDRRHPGDSRAVTELSYWDEEFVASASYLVSSRTIACDGLARLVEKRSLGLVDAATISFSYAPRMEIPEIEPGTDSSARRQMIAAALEQQLAARREDEFRRGMSLVGPQRDDFLYSIDGRPLAQFGSRGQQRLGVVAYKLSEADLIAEVSGEQPVLLLDDVLSELDAVHRDLLLAAIARGSCQLFVTSTDPSSLDHPALIGLEAVDVQGGHLHPRL
ncbi:MAG: DNA recombination and repair protein RecF [uncultured Thermomicrobiales bacterium]|uniref:DNA replication and repair protein RecF n=1 Tax=uncultured Thermomicrobiales bacterium TaxID=1645740 RepID=A0A6J4V346_9BACT|nr:MAG: DNA recombination and repair protein RecF [uncultured Thermomicrobiales bacterium]